MDKEQETAKDHAIWFMDFGPPDTYCVCCGSELAGDVVYEIAELSLEQETELRGKGFSPVGLLVCGRCFRPISEQASPLHRYYVLGPEWVERLASTQARYRKD